MKRLTLTLGLLALAAVLAACSGASAAPNAATPPPAGSPSGNGVTIVAKDLKFDQAAVAVKADAPFAITFENRDGAPHNVAISDVFGSTVFKGDIVSNTSVTYNVPALAAGTYTFICEVHPDMKGTITAK
jgi:plastocyanin